MPERSSKKKDMNGTAFSIMQRATGQVEERNSAAVALGRLGGLKGGKARAKALTKKQRSEIARLAAAARWKKSES